MKRRISSAVSLTLGSVLSLGVASSAMADIGPAPSCPSGTHSAYLYGRRCVKNGYHLVAGPDGHVTEVPDAKPVADPTAKTPSPAATPTAVPTPTPAATAAAIPAEPQNKTPQEPPQKSGKTGGCSMSEGDIPMLGTTLLAAGLLGLALALRRRREHS